MNGQRRANKGGSGRGAKDYEIQHMKIAGKAAKVLADP
jgi:hypothetical protein